MPGIHPDTPLPTPTGWTTAATVQCGDEVFDGTGQITSVSSVAPIREKDGFLYRIASEDVVVSAHHDLYISYHQRKRNRLTLTARIAIQMPDIDLPMDPWLFGYWCATSGTDLLLVPAENREWMHQRLSDLGHQTRRVANIVDDHAVIEVPGLGEGIEMEEVKHVPASYLRAGTQQRAEILDGILDGIGILNARDRNTVIKIVSRFPTQILLDATELAWSTGTICTFVRSHPVTYARFLLRQVRLRMRHQEQKEFLAANEVATRPHRVRFSRGTPLTLHGNLVDLRTAAGSYVMGRGMVPVRDH